MTIYEILTIAVIALLAAATTAAVWLGLMTWIGQCVPIGREWRLRRKNMPRVP